MLVHNGLLIGHGVGAVAQAHADVAGHNDGGVVVAAAAAEGDDIAEDAGGDDLGGEDDHEGADDAQDLGHVNGHHGHAQEDLQADIAEGVQFLSTDLYLGHVQNVAEDDAADHTADEVGELDHGDHSGQNRNIGAQAGRHDDQAHAAQQVLVVQGEDLFLVLLAAVLTVQVMALDQSAGHRAAGQAGEHHAEGGAHNGQNRGVLGAQGLIGGGDGAGGAHAAHQGQGAQAQALEGMHAQGHGQDHAQNILPQDQANGGDGNADTHLAARLNELPGGGQTDSGEEDVHEPLFQHRDVEVHLQNITGPKDAQHNADQQTGHHDAGHAVSLEELDPLDDGPSHQGNQSCDGGALHDVKGDLQHTHTLPFRRNGFISLIRRFKIGLIPSGAAGKTSPADCLPTVRAPCRPVRIFKKKCSRPRRQSQFLYLWNDFCT